MWIRTDWLLHVNVYRLVLCVNAYGLLLYVDAHRLILCVDAHRLIPSRTDMCLQTGFIKFIVLPTYEALSEVLPPTRDTALKNLMETLEVSGRAFRMLVLVWLREQAPTIAATCSHAHTLHM